MLKRLAVVGLVVAALAVAPPAQAAPFLSGGFSFSSINLANGASSLIPIGTSGEVLTSFIGATRLDFTTTGAATPGTAGNFEVDATAGSFSGMSGQIGQIKDFTFQGPGNSNYPYPPVTNFEVITTSLFSFDLTSVVVQGPPLANLLSLTGTGMLRMAGFESTPGTFVFSANNASGTFSYSASNDAGIVPEPGSMMLLGSGLIGLAGAVRRRMKK